MKARVLSWVASKLMSIAAKHPYRHLFHADGRPYMKRYWLLKVGRGEEVDGELMPRWLGIRLHVICSSDDDRVFHDHPWWFVTLLLAGGFYEHRPINPSDWDWTREQDIRWHGAGSLLFRKAEHWHRLSLPEGHRAVTLFIHGPRAQSWGFLFKGRKMPWREFVTMQVSDVRAEETSA